MTLSRKSYRSEQAAKLKQQKRDRFKVLQTKSIASLALAALLAGGSAGIAAPTLAMTSISTSSVSDGQIDAPTLNTLNLSQDGTAINVDVFQQANEYPNITVDVVAKTVTPEGLAEKHALDTATSAAEAQYLISEAAYEDYNNWPRSIPAPDPKTGAVLVTFKDGTTQSFANQTAVNEALGASLENYETEQAKYQSLSMEVQKARVAFDAATAPREDWSAYTVTLSASNSPYGNRTWETAHGVVQVGDSFALNAGDITGSATVASTDSAGNLVLDVQFSEALSTPLQPSVSYTVLEEEVTPTQPGTVADDAVSIAYNGEATIVDLGANDTGEFVSTRIADPVTGEPVGYVVVPEQMTAELRSNDTVSILGVREFTGTTVFTIIRIDIAGNEHRSALTVNHQGKAPWIATSATDGSGIDLSDVSKHYELVNNVGSYVPIEYRKNPSYRGQDGLVSAEKPTALADLAIRTQGSQNVVNPFVNDNAGITMNERFGFDHKAQERIIEDASLQILNPGTGKHVSLGTNVDIEGKATATIVPATGTDEIVPVDTRNGTATFAFNEMDRPLVAVKGNRSFRGDVAIPYRWKTVSYGETTADLDAFWAQYDATGEGIEFVGESVIHLKFEAPDFTKGRATNRAAELNGPAPARTGVWDPTRYFSTSNTTGSGTRPPLFAEGTDDSYELPALVTSGTFGVGDKDLTAALSTNFSNSYVGTSDSDIKPFGIKTADGAFVQSLVIEGEGTWVIHEDIKYYNADYNAVPAPVEGGSWIKEAHLLFRADAGYEGSSSVTFVNENQPFMPVEGITVKATNGITTYEADLDTLKLVDENGALVDSYEQAGIGTFTVVDGKVRFEKDPSFKGDRVQVQRSIVDRWIGTPEQQKDPSYDIAVKPYGAESRALLVINIDGGIEVPEIPEVPVPTDPTPVPTEPTPVPTDPTPVDPEPTPEPVPTPAPEPTPVPTEPTPEPVPTPVPTDPTPEPTPELPGPTVPEPTPVPTEPTPEPEIPVTPTPSPEPTPDLPPVEETPVPEDEVPTPVTPEAPPTEDETPEPVVPETTTPDVPGTDIETPEVPTPDDSSVPVVTAPVIPVVPGTPAPIIPESTPLADVPMSSDDGDAMTTVDTPTDELALTGQSINKGLFGHPVGVMV